MSKTSYVENLFTCEREPPKLLTMQEASARLRICRQTLAKLVKSDDVPCVKLGKKYMFDETTINEIAKR